MSVLLDALKKAALEKQKRNEDSPEGSSESSNAPDPELKIVPEPESSIADHEDEGVESLDSETASQEIPEEPNSIFELESKQVENQVEDEPFDESTEQLSPEFEAIESTFVSEDTEFIVDADENHTSDEPILTDDIDEPVVMDLTIDEEHLDAAAGELNGQNEDLQTAQMSEEELIALQMEMLEQEKNASQDNKKESSPDEIHATSEADENNEVAVNENFSESDSSTGSDTYQVSNNAEGTSQNMSDEELKELLSNVAIDDSLVSQIEKDADGIDDQHRLSFKVLLDKNKEQQRKKRTTFLILFGIVIFVAALVVVGYYFYVKSEGDNLKTIPKRTFADIGEQLPLSENQGTVTTSEGGVVDGNTVAQGDETMESTIKEANASVTEDKLPEALNNKHSNNNVKNSQKEISSTIVPNKWAYSGMHAQSGEIIVPNNNIITLGKSKAAPVTQYIERAYKAYQQGDFGIARQEYEKALALDPNHRDGLLGAAATATVQGRYEQAIHYYQRQLSQVPQDDYAHSGLLSIAMREGVTPEILSKVNSLIKENPKAAHLHFLKGTLFAKQKQWPAAQESFFRAWSLESERADYTYNLAISLDHLRQYKEALRFYRQTLQLTNLNLSETQVMRLQLRIQQLEVLNE